MYRIGDFSKMSKVTIKALRYYEEEGLLIPAFIDNNNHYRYYEGCQLIDLAKIVSLRQIGFTIEEIKRINMERVNIYDMLDAKREEIKNNIEEYNYQLSKINYLLEEEDMQNEVFVKEISAYYVYYKEGVLKDYSQLSEFIQESGRECLKLNPDIKCVKPDYCYVNYLDGEYREKDIKVRYVQAVIEGDKQFIESDSIKFMEIPEVTAICIYHRGAYDELGKSYSKILKYIEDNNYKIIDYPRECYIDGIWNKENVEDWLTEIQIPIERII